MIQKTFKMKVYQSKIEDYKGVFWYIKGMVIQVIK